MQVQKGRHALFQLPVNRPLAVDAAVRAEKGARQVALKRRQRLSGPQKRGQTSRCVGPETRRQKVRKRTGPLRGRQAGAALIGGETAEMPGFYPVDEYDLAGFAVGIVDQKDLITGADIKAGDVLIGMASSGVHSNGFSLVRKVFNMKEEYMNTYFEILGRTLGEALIEPTKIYVKALETVKNAGVNIKGCSHITGGGFYENIPRMLPDGMRAMVKKDSYEVPMIFQMLKIDGRIEEQMMYNTFNMGIGMVLAVDPSQADSCMEAIREAGETPYVLGEVQAGEKGVTLC